MKDTLHLTATRLAEWKAEIGDVVQDLCSETLFPKCRFSRNAGERGM